MSNMSSAELGLSERDLGFNREESTRPTVKNMPGLRGVQEFAGGAPKNREKKTPQQAVEAVRTLLLTQDDAESQEEHSKIKELGFLVALHMVVADMDAIKPSELVQRREAVTRAVNILTDEYLLAAKKEGISDEERMRVFKEYGWCSKALSELQMALRREPATSTGERKTRKTSAGVEEEGKEKITKENWQIFAHRLLNSKGAPITWSGVYGEMDDVAMSITSRLEALATELEETKIPENLRVAEQINATVHLRHCAFIMKGMPPIKAIKDRVDKALNNEPSKSRLLSSVDLDLFLSQGMPGLSILESLGDLQEAYLNGSLTKRNITESERKAIFQGIVDKYGGDEAARLSLDYADNLSWALGLVAEWNREDRRATNLSKLIYIGDYRRGESGVSDGGMTDTKNLVEVMPIGSFLRCVRTNHRYPSQFRDCNGNLVTAKAAETMYLVNPVKDRPEEYDPFCFTGVNTKEAHVRSMVHYTGWYLDKEGATYYPIDLEKLDYKSLPQGSYEGWLKNVKRASIAAGWLLQSSWATSHVGSDQLQEMSGVISGLDPSDAANLRTVLVITVIKSILSEGVELGQWRVTETKKFFDNLQRPLGQTTLGQPKRFITEEDLRSAFVECGYHSKFVYNSIVSVLDSVQKEWGRLAVTGR